MAVGAYSLLSALISAPTSGSRPSGTSNSLSHPNSAPRAAAATSILAPTDSSLADASSSASDADDQALREVMEQLSNDGTSEPVAVQLWSTLATFAGNRREALR